MFWAVSVCLLLTFPLLVISSPAASLLSAGAHGVHGCRPQRDADIRPLWDGAVGAEHNLQRRVPKLHLCQGNCC